VIFSQAEAQREAARKQKEQVRLPLGLRLPPPHALQERLDADKAAALYRARMCDAACGVVSAT